MAKGKNRLSRKVQKATPPEYYTLGQAYDRLANAFHGPNWSKRAPEIARRAPFRLSRRPRGTAKLKYRVYVAKDSSFKGGRLREELTGDQVLTAKKIASLFREIKSALRTALAIGEVKHLVRFTDGQQEAVPADKSGLWYSRYRSIFETGYVPAPWHGGPEAIGLLMIEKSSFDAWLLKEAAKRKSGRKLHNKLSEEHLEILYPYIMDFTKMSQNSNTRLSRDEWREIANLLCELLDIYLPKSGFKTNFWPLVKKADPAYFEANPKGGRRTKDEVAAAKKVFNNSIGILKEIQKWKSEVGLKAAAEMLVEEMQKLVKRKSLAAANP